MGGAKTPEQQFFDLAKAEGQIDEATVADVFDQLKPVAPGFLIGDWTGGSFNTGHPAQKQLETARWAGKCFKTVDDVDPVMVYQDDGSRVWNQELGNARLREVKYKDKVSTAMIYDKFPIIDSFRYVSEDTVMGLMDNKLNPPGAGTFYFYLTRI